MKYTFSLSLLADVSDRFVKNVSTTCVHLETARERMIKKYPLSKGFFFELYSTMNINHKNNETRN